MAHTSPLLSGYGIVEIKPDPTRDTWMLTKNSTMFWAITSDNKIHKSSDAVTWSDVTSEMAVALSLSDSSGDNIQFQGLKGFGGRVATVVRQYLLIPDTVTYYAVIYDGSSWVKTDITTWVQLDQTNTYGNLYEANGYVFFSNRTGVRYSTDGVTWSLAFSLPGFIVGEPEYSSTNVIYRSGTYFVYTYSIGAISPYPRTHKLYSSSDLISWAADTIIGLPNDKNFSSMLSSGSYFYHQDLYNVYESTDGVSWSTVESVLSNYGVVFTVLEDGFLGGATYLTFLPYAKTQLRNVSDQTTIQVLSIPGEFYDKPFIVGDTVYFSKGGKSFRFKYDQTWDDGSVIVPITATLVALGGDDVVEVSGIVIQYTAVVQGTLKLDKTTGAFAARPVILFTYPEGVKVAETTSDGTTGTWTFTQVPPGDYFVVGLPSIEDSEIYNRDFDADGIITVA